MEHSKRTVTGNPSTPAIHPHEFEQASNSYLMCIISVIAGMPLPVINLIASVGYYLGNRRAGYFVRWHCIQSILAQMIMIPFNSILFGWTIAIWYNDSEISVFFATYVFTILFLNLVEFFTVVITAIKVREGHDVRWFIIANIADRLTSKENRDIYQINQ